MRTTRSLLVLMVVGGLLVATQASATFTGTNGRISFHRFIEDKDGPGTGNVEIFSAGPNGGSEQRLTFSNDGRGAAFSDWSPDGQRIAFDSDRIDEDGMDEVVQVYLMPWNGETFGLTQLTKGPGFHGDPAWSPNGTRIAMDADWGDYPALQGIWTVPSTDPDGVTVGEAQRVTSIPAGMDFDGEPQYSPDGQWIVFTRLRSCNFTERGHQAFNAHNCKSAIFKVRTNGSGLVQLTPWGMEASAADWSPNGAKITFDAADSGRHGSKGDIWVMNANGSARKRLTDNPPVTNAGHDFENVRFEYGNNPVWSPNGSKILYSQWQGGGFPVYLMTMNPDGSNKTVVVNGDEFQNKADWGTHP